MRIELIPLIFAAVIALIGLGVIADALLPEEYYVTRERRRRTRTERHRGGEAVVGVGILALAAALAGRDSWRYGTVAIIVGAVLVVAGAGLNARYLREVFSFRGAARRADPQPPPPPAGGAPPLRLR